MKVSIGRQTCRWGALSCNWQGLPSEWVVAKHSPGGEQSLPASSCLSPADPEVLTLSMARFTFVGQRLPQRHKIATLASLAAKSNPFSSLSAKAAVSPSFLQVEYFLGSGILGDNHVRVRELHAAAATGHYQRCGHRWHRCKCAEWGRSWRAASLTPRPIFHR
jgi:hypothetical protein